MADETLFHVDVLTAAGKALGIEDGSATIQGALGFANTTVPNSNPNAADGQRRARVARSIAAKILFKPGVNVADFAKMKNIQITLRDLQSGRRCMANNCSIATMGDIGSGTVDIVFNVLEPYQWL
jgi:hypothetical protein